MLRERRFSRFSRPGFGDRALVIGAAPVRSVQARNRDHDRSYISAISGATGNCLSITRYHVVESVVNVQGALFVARVCGRALERKR